MGVEDIARMERRQLKWMLYLLAIFLFGGAITPYERFFLGLLVRHVVSYYGLRLLQNRAKAFGRLAVDGKRTPGLGTFFRLIGAGVAIWLALKYEEKIHIIGVVLGLTTSYVVMIKIGRAHV